MAGVGDLELTPPFKKYQVDIDVWASWSKDQRDKHFKKFMGKLWLKEKSTVISSDGLLTVKGPGMMGGKKPHQRKRRRMAKTTAKK